MKNLLTANAFRMFRHKAFWAAAAFLALYGGFEAVGLYRQGEAALSYGLFAGVTFLGVALAAFCSFFLGTEYQDGALRNKVSAGYRRSQIYLSGLLICLLGGGLIWCAYEGIYLLVGRLLLGGEHMDWGAVAGKLLTVLFLILSYVALYTCLGSLPQNKATLTAVALLLSFAMLFCGLYLYNRLDEPPVYPAEIQQQEREMEQGARNPYYLQGTAREVYEVLYDLLPNGQGMQILSDTLDTPEEGAALAGISLGTAGVWTALGLVVFQRRDLR